MECNRKSKQAPGFSAFPQNMTGVQIESCGLEVPGTPQTQQVPTLGHVVANPADQAMVPVPSEGGEMNF